MTELGYLYQSIQNGPYQPKLDVPGFYSSISMANNKINLWSRIGLECVKGYII